MSKCLEAPYPRSKPAEYVAPCQLGHPVVHVCHNAHPSPLVPLDLGVSPNPQPAQPPVNYLVRSPYYVRPLMSASFVGTDHDRRYDDSHHHSRSHSHGHYDHRHSDHHYHHSNSHSHSHHRSHSRSHHHEHHHHHYDHDHYHHHHHYHHIVLVGESPM